MCIWLNAKSPQESDKLFTKYYRGVAEQLLPFARWRLSDKHVHLANDVFQEVMISHLKHMAHTRPENAAKVIFYLDELRRPSGPDIHAKQLAKWAREAEDWVTRTMAVHTLATHGQQALIDEIQLLNQIFDALQKDGGRLLGLGDTHGGSMEVMEEKIESMPPPCVLGDVLSLLPGIRLPSLSLLYRMVHTKIFDFARATPGIFVSLEAESQLQEDVLSVPAPAELHEELALRDCYRLLDRSHAQALAELGVASSKKESGSAMQRVKKQAEKYALNCAVLRLAMDGYSESEMVTSLGISRDKIRACKSEIRMLLSPYVSQ